MGRRYYIHNSMDLTRLVYNHIDNRNDKLQLALVNKKMLSLCFSEKCNLIYNLRSQQELSQPYNLPVSTAANFRLSNMTEMKNAFVDALIKHVRICHIIRINISHDLTQREIEKIVKTCLRKGVNIIIESSPQKRLFDSLIRKYDAKYLQRYESYRLNKNAPVLESKALDVTRKRKITLEVPENPAERLKYLLSECQKLTNVLTMIPSCIDQDAFFMIPNNLRTIVASKAAFQLCQKNIKELTIDKHNICTSILTIGKTFVNCFIVFEEITFYITSVDIFIHNDMNVDDCAYGIKEDDYFTMPTPKMICKTSMGKSFYELKIFWGHLEFLAVGGYHGHRKGKFVLFLGSALRNWNYGTMNNGKVYVQDMNEDSVVCTPRLLNQYTKQHSHMPFRLHALNSSLEGFTPISPIDFLAHKSQKYKKLNVHHLSSKALYMFTSRQQVNNESLKEVFMLFTNLDVYRTKCKEKKTYPTNFITFKEIYDDKKKDTYIRFLLDLLSLAEEKIEEYEQFDLYNAFDSTTALKRKTLQIMEGGLKSAILNQTKAIEKKEAMKMN